MDGYSGFERFSSLNSTNSYVGVENVQIRDPSAEVYPTLIPEIGGNLNPIMASILEASKYARSFLMENFHEGGDSIGTKCINEEKITKVPMPSISSSIQTIQPSISSMGLSKSNEFILTTSNYAYFSQSASSRCDAPFRENSLNVANSNHELSFNVIQDTQIRPFGQQSTYSRPESGARANSWNIGLSQCAYNWTNDNKKFFQESTCWDLGKYDMNQCFEEPLISNNKSISTDVLKGSLSYVPERSEFISSKKSSIREAISQISKPKFNLWESFSAKIEQKKQSSRIWQEFLKKTESGKNQSRPPLWPSTADELQTSSAPYNQMLSTKREAESITNEKYNACCYSDSHAIFVAPSPNEVMLKMNSEYSQGQGTFNLARTNLWNFNLEAERGQIPSQPGSPLLSRIQTQSPATHLNASSSVFFEQESALLEIATKDGPPSENQYDGNYPCYFNLHVKDTRSFQVKTELVGRATPRTHEELELTSKNKVDVGAIGLSNAFRNSIFKVLEGQRRGRHGFDSHFLNVENERGEVSNLNRNAASITDSKNNLHPISTSLMQIDFHSTQAHCTIPEIANLSNCSVHLDQGGETVHRSSAVLLFRDKTDDTNKVGSEGASDENGFCVSVEEMGDCNSIQPTSEESSTELFSKDRRVTVQSVGALNGACSETGESGLEDTFGPSDLTKGSVDPRARTEHSSHQDRSYAKGKTHIKKRSAKWYAYGSLEKQVKYFCFENRCLFDRMNKRTERKRKMRFRCVEISDLENVGEVSCKRKRVFNISNEGLFSEHEPNGLVDEVVQKGLCHFPGPVRESCLILSNGPKAAKLEMRDSWNKYRKMIFVLSFHQVSIAATSEVWACLLSLISRVVHEQGRYSSIRNFEAMRDKHDQRVLKCITWKERKLIESSPSISSPEKAWTIALLINQSSTVACERNEEKGRDNENCCANTEQVSIVENIKLLFHPQPVLTWYTKPPLCLSYHDRSDNLEQVDKGSHSCEEDVAKNTEELSISDGVCMMNEINLLHTAASGFAEECESLDEWIENALPQANDGSLNHLVNSQKAILTSSFAKEVHNSNENQVPSDDFFSPFPVPSKTRNPFIDSSAYENGSHARSSPLHLELPSESGHSNDLVEACRDNENLELSEEECFKKMDEKIDDLVGLSDSNTSEITETENATGLLNSVKEWEQHKKLTTPVLFILSMLSTPRSKPNDNNIHKIQGRTGSMCYITDHTKEIGSKNRLPQASPWSGNKKRKMSALHPSVRVKKQDQQLPGSRKANV